MIVGCSLCGAILVGLGITKCKRIAITIIGAAGGCSLGVVITTSAMIDKTAIFFSIIGGCALVAGILAFFL